MSKPVVTPADMMEPAERKEPAQNKRLSLVERSFRLLFFIVCLEVGLFLTIFPWIPDWSINYFSSIDRSWHGFWLNHYFRGAVSGLGIMNILLSLYEMLVLSGVLPPRPRQ